MKRRVLCLLFAFVLAFSYIPVGAIEISVPDRIDGSDADLKFYTEASELISRYWEDDYFNTLYYSYEDGACQVDGSWYIPVRSFCKDAGITYKRSGKKFTMSSGEFTWECKINKKASTSLDFRVRMLRPSSHDEEQVLKPRPQVPRIHLS